MQSIKNAVIATVLAFVSVSAIAAEVERKTVGVVQVPSVISHGHYAFRVSDPKLMPTITVSPKAFKALVGGNATFLSTVDMCHNMGHMGDYYSLTYVSVVGNTMYRAHVDMTEQVRPLAKSAQNTYCRYDEAENSIVVYTLGK